MGLWPRVCFVNFVEKWFQLLHKGDLNLRINRLSGDMSFEVAVVVGPSRGGLPTYAADVRLFAGVNLHVVSEIVAPGESLVAVRTNMIPLSVMLLNMTLVIGFHRKLNTAFVADVRLDPFVSTQVLLQQSLSQVGLIAYIALEGPEPLVLVLPHVVFQVVLGDKHLLADLAGEVLLALVDDPNMFTN